MDITTTQRPTIRCYPIRDGYNNHSETVPQVVIQFEMDITTTQRPTTRCYPIRDGYNNHSKSVQQGVIQFKMYMTTTQRPNKKTGGLIRIPPDRWITTYFLQTSGSTK
ncbi:hypothetical protein CHS0354_007006 [Potamilus streckersoni]|uniref:Uncharacterized protein n=1 Tax=Potamilus streckersoni TaxID=2493646 RepID=A0AAE0RWI9_9BIVA|nr:hypothetical protein CHS0354_007006 [Potamilus streckersoni]